MREVEETCTERRSINNNNLRLEGRLYRSNGDALSAEVKSIPFNIPPRDRRLYITKQYVVKGAKGRDVNSTQDRHS